MYVNDDKIKELNEKLFEYEEKRKRHRKAGRIQEARDTTMVMRGITSTFETLGIELDGKWGGLFYKRKEKSSMDAMIGTEFVSQLNYPFGNPGLTREDKSLDVHKGETLRVIEYDASLHMYKVLNVSLGTPEAWFILSPVNLKVLIGKAIEE